MGTRGAIGLRHEGQDKISYNHFDSYLSGLGVAFIEGLHGRTKAELVGAFARLELIDSESVPTPEQVAACEATADFSVSTQSADDWYCLLRGAQGDVTAWFDGPPYILDAADFLADSLFCEWAYLVNLDEDAVEIYCGFNKDPAAAGRYAALGEGSEYRGVALIKTVPLAEVLEGRFGAADMATLDAALQNEDAA